MQDTLIHSHTPNQNQIVVYTQRLIDSLSHADIYLFGRCPCMCVLSHAFHFALDFHFEKPESTKTALNAGARKKKHTQADERRKFIFAIQINLRSPVIIASTSIFTSICCMQSEAEREKTLILRKLRKIS